LSRVTATEIFSFKNLCLGFKKDFSINQYLEYFQSSKLPVGNGNQVPDNFKIDDRKKPSPPSLSSGFYIFHNLSRSLLTFKLSLCQKNIFTENSQSCDSADLCEIVEDGSEKACIMIRFPDGKKVKKDIPSNNKFGVTLFLLLNQKKFS